MTMPPQVGAAVLVTDGPGGERILVGKRGPDSKRGVGVWSVPGGAVDPGESIKEAAVRELREETSLEMGIGNADVVAVTEAFFEGEHWITFYVTSFGIKGEPRVTEPGKCEGWEFIYFSYLRDMPLLPSFEKLVSRDNWFARSLCSTKDILR